MDPVTDTLMMVWAIGTVVATFASQWRITYREETGQLVQSSLADDRCATFVGSLLWPFLCAIFVIGAIPMSVLVWGPRLLIRHHYSRIATEEKRRLQAASTRRIESDISGRIGGEIEDDYSN